MESGGGERLRMIRGSFIIMASTFIILTVLTTPTIMNEGIVEAQIQTTNTDSNMIQKE
jgi:hypothetical protein